jgi:hypothetical protein
MDALPAAVLVGGGLYVLAKSGNGQFFPPGPTGYQTPRPGATSQDIVNGIPNGDYSYDPYLDDSGQSAFNIDGRLVDPSARPKLDLLDSAMQYAYGQMSAAAKAKAADELNQKLNLDPPLRGNEDWQTIARAAGGAIGGVACNAIPGIGTAATPLCAMAGSYLGVQLEQWMQTEMPGLESWVSENVGNVVSSIGDKISDWLHDLF